MAVDKKTLKCNKPRRTPGHKTKSHIVKACSAGKEKISTAFSMFSSKASQDDKSFQKQRQLNSSFCKIF